MYISRNLRALAATDPTILERARAAACADQRRDRLLDRINTAAAWIETLDSRTAAGIKVRRVMRETALHRLQYLTAAAERAGLIAPRKDTAR